MSINKSVNSDEIGGELTNSCLLLVTGNVLFWGVFTCGVVNHCFLSDFCRFCWDDLKVSHPPHLAYCTHSENTEVTLCLLALLQIAAVTPLSYKHLKERE
ncbi:uncharacterized protein V6R79_017988 [Siganus canaliculatus]